MHPIQASWTDCSLLNRWSVEILKISKIGEIAMKNLIIFMSSGAIPILFRRNPSARWILQSIPYNRLEQTAPCLIAGQLKSWKSAKSAKLDEKPQQLHEFLCDSQSVSTEFKRSFDNKIHPIQSSWTDHSFLKRWSVEYPKINKIGEIGWKTSISSWILVRFPICFDGIQALDGYYNSSHTIVLNRPLLPEAVVSWISKNQQKAKILNFKLRSGWNYDKHNTKSTKPF